MRVLDFLIFGLGMAVGWTVEKSNFWLLAFFIAYMPLLALAIITAERIVLKRTPIKDTKEEV